MRVLKTLEIRPKEWQQVLKICSISGRGKIEQKSLAPNHCLNKYTIDIVSSYKLEILLSSRNRFYFLELSIVTTLQS